MKLRVHKQWLALTIGLSGLMGLPGLIVSGCGLDPAPPPATTADVADVIYEGLATDEALIVMLAAQAQTDPAQSAVIDTPAADMVLPSAKTPTFSWHVGEVARAPRLNVNPNDSRWASALHSLLEVREAHAHGAPINGRAYFLVFSTPGAPKFHRVFTTELTYTPDAAAWAKLVSAKGPITLTILNAVFESNRVAQDGGPFMGPSNSFSIAK